MSDELRQQVRATAYALRDLGIAVMPVGRAKRPTVKWLHLKDQLPTDQEMSLWFPTAGRGPDGVGVICGTISGAGGRLEMFEFEGRAVELIAQWQQLMNDNGFGDLLRRLTFDGYMEQTPSGGIHIYYRYTGDPEDADTIGNTKVASRPATEAELAENPAEKIKVLIETRGEGGYSVVAPSAGECIDQRYGPDAGPWRPLFNDPRSIPTITAQERDALINLARALDRTPATAPAPDYTRPTKPRDTTGGPSPIDDYNAKHTIRELIEADGWTYADKVGARYGYARPGKHPRDGHSATVDPETGCLYVFSSAAGLPVNVPMDPAGYYAHTQHGGNFSEASRALRKAGYGAPREPRQPNPADTPKKSKEDGGRFIDGNLATVADIAQERGRRRPAPGLAGYTYTDVGNATLLLEQHRDRIRYCREAGLWLAWDGTRWEWQPKGGGAARRLAMETIIAMEPDDEAGEKWKRKSLSAGALRSMLDIAELSPGITISRSQLDAQPWEINTPAGIVNLKTGELHPHDPTKLHTRMTKVGPDFNADRTVWHKFLQDTFGSQDADDLIAYMQRALAYSLVGEVRENALFFCYGSGGNGKTVLLETVLRLVGDYGTPTPNRYLMERKAEAHPTEIADLAGARFAVGAEVKEEDYFDQNRVKAFTGGDTLKARYMHQDMFSFIPTHHLWLMGNNKPQVRGGGGRSFWRRVRLIPFLNEVDPADVDTELQSKLIDRHGPAILAWLIEGAAAYAKQGLAPEPAIVAQATAEYADAEDTLRGFIEDRCTIGDPPNPNLQVTVARFADTYTAWCKENALPAPNVLRLGDKLKHYGVMVGRSAPRAAGGGPRVYGNIMLRSTEADEDPRFIDS